MTAPVHYEPHVDRIDYGVLDVLVGYAVRRAQLTVTEVFDRQLAPFGITTQRFSAMVLIARNEGLRQATLAALMGTSAPQVSGVIDSLAQRGLVKRRPDAEDRRAFALALTRKGRARLPALEAGVLAHDRSLTADLSPNERLLLRDLLERLRRD